jgi:hypothetical protein
MKVYWSTGYKAKWKCQGTKQIFSKSTRIVHSENYLSVIYEQVNKARKNQVNKDHVRFKIKRIPIVHSFLLKFKLLCISIDQRNWIFNACLGPFSSSHWITSLSVGLCCWDSDRSIFMRAKAIFSLMYVHSVLRKH